MTPYVFDSSSPMSVITAWVAQDFPGPRDTRSRIYAGANAIARGLAVTA